MKARLVMIRFRVFLLLLAVIISLGLFATVGARPDSPLQNSQVAPTPIVPSFISYQGRVTIGGALYDGIGYFQFAIVDSVGTSHWSSGTITATVADGYFSFAQLGSTSPITVGIFASSDRLLRVWFGTDGSTFEQLSPDTAIASVPYSQRAQEVDWTGVQNQPATITPQPTPTLVSTATPQPEPTLVPTATPQPTPTPITNVVTGTGSSGQVAYFTGSTSIASSSDFVWDATKKALGLGMAPNSTDRLSLSKSFGDISGQNQTLYVVAGSARTSSGSSNLYSIYFSTIHNHAYDDTGMLVGVRGQTYTSSSGQLSNGVGLYGATSTASGSGGIINAYGVYGQVSASSAGIITTAYGLQSTIADLVGSRIKNAFGLYILFSGTGYTVKYGAYISPVSGAASANYALVTNAGTVHLGDATEAMTITPLISATYNLGSSALAWNQVHAHQYLTYSFSDWSQGVRLQTGEVVSCTTAMARLRASATQTVKTSDGDKPHLDYASIPLAARVHGPDEWVTRIVRSETPDVNAISSSPIVYDDKGNVIAYDNIYKILLKGQDGADMDVMQSILLCAASEMDAKSKSLDDKLKALEADVKALKDKIK